MPGHRFTITVEALSDRQGNPVEKAPLSFEVTNHDDILGSSSASGRVTI